MEQGEIIYKEINGSKYVIDSKIYLPKGKMKEIIIACHGFGGDKESSAIEALAEKMLPHNIGVICFDFPSHGKSKVNADELTIDNCIQDIEDIKKYIKERFNNIPIDIFATSFGAYITLLDIKKRNSSYNKILLRAPALKMDEILKNSLLRENMKEYKERGYTQIGFEREMDLPYDFYIELVKNNIYKIFEDNEMPFINIIQGDKDDIAPIEDTKEFATCHPDKIKLDIIQGADHRMKGPGELEEAMQYTEKIIL